MSVWARDQDGNRVLVNDEDIAAAERAGLTIEPGQEVTKRGIMGTASTISSEEAGGVVASGQELETAAQRHEREREARIEEEFSGPGAAIEAGVFGLARGASLGTSDMLARALGADPWEMQQLRNRQFAASLGGEIVGALGTGGAGLVRTPAALANRAASAFARGRGVGSAVLRGGAEGVLHGAGEGITQTALSDDPITAESIISNVSSGMLYGGIAGGAGGLAGKALEAGLGKAARALRRRQSKLGELPESLDDLGDLDAAGLRAAREAEIQRIDADRAARKESFPERLTEYADEAEAAVSDMWTDLQDLPKRSPLRKKLLKPLNQAHGSGRGYIRNKLLTNKIRLQETPQAAQRSLQESAQVLEDLTGSLDEIRRADPGLAMKIEAKIDDLTALQQKNASLRSEITDLTGKPTSQRLDDIAKARDILASQPAQKEGFGEKMLKGGIFGAVAGIVPGAAAVPAAAFVADKVGDLVFRRAGKAVGETTERLTKALEQVVSVTQRAAPRAPVLASKVLAQARFADAEPDVKGSDRTATAYRKRAAEIRAQVVPTPQGPQVTPAARTQIATRLAPVAVMDPLLADQLETIAARRLEYLASKLPQQPGLGIQTGPDTWEPSAFAVAEFARHVAAVEDPIAVLERAADGTMTTEDAEALREVYPELYEATRAEIMGRLPQLQEQLPYERQLMLGILFNVPVHPAMERNILEVLQGHFANEEPSAGGTQAPMPNPSFGKLGSVAKPEFTPAQERAG